MIPPLPTFKQVLAAAIADLSTTGYTNPDRIAEWLIRLRNAAEREIGPETEIERDTARRLIATFERLIDRDGILKFVPEVSRYTRAMIRPQLRAELDRRIMAAAELIRLDRRKAVQGTLDRFSGWSTSIPPGGDQTIDKVETRQALGKSVGQFRYEWRRLQNDQGHKLVANIADIVAQGAGAIAGIWNDHGEHDRSYNARKEHLARSGKTYLIRGSWAHAQGLVTAVNGFTDEITAPGQEVSCRCWYQFIASPRRLPDQFLTRKGQDFVSGGGQRNAA